MSLRDKLIIWIYRKGNQLDNEVEQLQQYSKYYPLDSLDHYEYMHAKIRLQAFKEFLDELFKIVINCK